MYFEILFSGREKIEQSLKNALENKAKQMYTFIYNIKILLEKDLSFKSKEGQPSSVKLRKRKKNQARENFSSEYLLRNECFKLRSNLMTAITKQCSHKV